MTMMEFIDPPHQTNETVMIDPTNQWIVLFDGANNLDQFDDLNQTNCYRSTSLEIVTNHFIQSCLAILYSCTAVLSLIGNIMIILVQLFAKEHGHHFRRYLINLAISDIIIGVFCVPFTYTDFVLRQWTFPHWLCPTAQFVQLLSVFITANTLAIIGIERAIATLYPLTEAHQWMQQHTNHLIASTWMCGILYAYVPYSHTYTRQYGLNGHSFYQCSYDNGLTVEKRRLLMTLNFILTFAMPSIILTISYVAIMKQLHHRGHIRSCGYRYHTPSNSPPESLTTNRVANNVNSINGNARESPQPIMMVEHFNFRQINIIQKRTKTLKIMFIIIILYDICWLPIKLFQILLDYDLISFCSEIQFYLLIYTYIGCHWLAMANSFVNPIVYSFMSKSFRNDFSKITKSVWKRKQRTILAVDNDNPKISSDQV